MAEVPYVDTHFHVWELSRFKYPWPNSSVPAIHKDILPSHYIEETKSTKVKHGIFVQCLNRSAEEAKWVLGMAKEVDIIKGVVAGLDLTDPRLEETVVDLKKDPHLVGCRHILDSEQVDWIMRPEVHRGLRVLERHGIPFDLLLRPHLLKYIPHVVQKFPGLMFVVDHIAKPYIKDKKFDGWRQDIREISNSKNVYCKISGLVTEADFKDWKVEDFQPYIKHILSVFGVDRCMFGSDWPVCKLAGASYERVVSLSEELLKDLSDNDKAKIFYHNAVRFYNLKL